MLLCASLEQVGHTILGIPDRNCVKCVNRFARIRTMVGTTVMCVDVILRLFLTF